MEGFPQKRKEEEDHEPQEYNNCFGSAGRNRVDKHILDSGLLEGNTMLNRMARYTRECGNLYQRRINIKTKFLNLDTNYIIDLKEVHVWGRGLRNYAGSNYGFLNVICQSLWRLRRFRDELMDVGSKYQYRFAAELYRSFVDMGKSSEECAESLPLRIGLTEHDPNKFEWRKMEDASEVLSEVISSLHQPYKDGWYYELTPRDPDETSTCDRKTCIAHKHFGMDISDEWICNPCNMANAQQKYTEFVHYITAATLRDMKELYADRSLGELWKKGEVEARTCAGCSKLIDCCHKLLTIPDVLICVLSFDLNETAKESFDTLEAISTEVEIDSYGRTDHNKHHLVSMICYLNSHYICFALNHGKWVKYDDWLIVVFGSWEDVVTYCKKFRYRPTVLFFEAASQNLS